VTDAGGYSYVFGIVPAGATAPAAGDGIASDLRLVPHGALAALVGTTPPDRRLGTAADLLQHDRVLTAVLEQGTPLLPMRFGSVLADDDAVVHELLDPDAERYADLLDELGDSVQYVVRARYVEDAIVREVLSSQPDLDRLRRAGHAREQASLTRRLAFGGRVVEAIEARRADDAQRLLDGMREATRTAVQAGGQPDQVLDVNVLVPRTRREAFEQSLEDLARDHAGRITLRLTGPSPVYSFVGG